MNKIIVNACVRQPYEYEWKCACASTNWRETQHSHHRNCVAQTTHRLNAGRHKNRLGKNPHTQIQTQKKNWNSRHKYMLEKRPLSYYTKPTDQSIKGKAAHCDKSPKWIAVMFSLEITSAFGCVFGNQTQTKETRKCIHCAFNWECFVQCQRERTIYTNICQSQIHIYSHSYPEFYIFFRTYNESDATLPVFLVIITYTWAVWSRLFTSLPLSMMSIVYVLFNAN